MNGFKALIGSAPAFEALIRSTQMVATTDVTALIIGETGTGKELMAKAIHVESHRFHKVFTAINCAALPDELAESELFGHRRGAFSGATHDHLGRLRASEGGTVFLDEVNELSPAIQAKLLRFLESGECQAIGETHTHHCNVRIIAATNCDLHQWVEEGRFRKDLYYRLHVVPLAIPPLRERKEDINPLIHHFCNFFSRQYKLASPQFSKTALSILNSYHWPGNIRELRNFCERIVVLLPGKIIEPQNLPFEMQGKDSSITTKAPIITLPENGLALDQVEIELIHQAIARAQGNRSKAARLLGISRDTLCYRMQKHAIDI
ncbi:sigma-54 interaction domain-containing protein [Candidatus Nitrosacidococcus sp. I8]|uniref:sigma-54 interaction domain-containing protein n=1 Tax=Candidatus Nitrosacidococcus sp. I8 TaxID=2942908 RepID=UPI002225D8BC|nr:sigma-54 dependent transcriptional regulator [Candidatus Nitrosacidococcus sp. I8]CAH9017650.1 Transcriptional regulatory protein ZraR [Candidatus Nitrosacidococcus sp. I8]